MGILFFLLIWVNVKGDVNLLKCRDFKDKRGGSGHNSITIPEVLSSEWSMDMGDLAFGLFEGKFTCHGKQSVISLNIELQKQFRQEPVDRARSFFEVNETGKSIPIHFTPTGYFYDGLFFHSYKDYCVQSISNEQLMVRTCTPLCVGSTVCIPKCCGVDEALDFWSFTCIKINQTGAEGRPQLWHPELYEEVWYSRTPKRINGIQTKFYLSKEFPQDCNVSPFDTGNFTESPFIKDYKSLAVNNAPEGFEYLKENHHLHLGIDSSGNLRPMVLYYAKRRITFWEEKITFCADAFLTNQNDLVKSNQFMIFYCTIDDWEGDELDLKRLVLKTWIYISTSLISLPFILTTVLIYFLLLSKLNLHSLTILSYSISELGLFSLSILPHFAYLYPEGLFQTEDEKERGGWFCYLIGVSAHFFFFSSSAWLTIMNFDLYSTFREMKVKQLEQDKWKKLLIYSILAWGVPLLVIGVFIGLDNYYRDPATLVVIPEYAASTCFVSKEARGFYVFLPLTIILGVNLIMVCLTLGIFFNARWNAKKVGAAGGRGTNRYSTKLFAKLFIMMGGVYIINYISWYYSYIGGDKPYWVISLEIIINFVPIAQFVLFCLNDSILRQMQEKYPRLKNGFNRVQKVFKMESGASSASTTDTQVDTPKRQRKRENVAETCQL